MRLGIFAVTGVLMLGGCTSSLAPLTQNSFATVGEACSGKADIALSICQTDAKAEDLRAAHGQWTNDPALFDVPILALAASAAGLLLFDAHTDALKAVGLGAGVLGVSRGYFNPQEVKTALLDGANGYSCLADAGGVVMSDQTDLQRLAREHALLKGKVNQLEAQLAQDPSSFSDAARASAALANARTAITLYDEQVNAAKYANLAMRSKARAISRGLLKRVERQPIDFTQVYRQLAGQAAATAERDAQVAEAEPVAAPVSVAGGKSGDQLVRQVEVLTTALLRMPDVKTSVAEFDKCVAESLSSSTT